MPALATAALLGLLLGVRHAFEPDHLAAVSTMVGEKRGTGFWLGGVWGLGHLLSLVVVGAALFALKLRLPAQLENLFELAVAAMLVALGVRALLRARHGHSHAPSRPGRRSLLVGMTHGLAGSGAVTVIAAAAMPGPLSCLAYIALFGVGAALGMGAMTAIAGRGVAALGSFARVQRGLAVTAGLVSLALGVVWGSSHALQLVRGEPSEPLAVVETAR